MKHKAMQKGRFCSMRILFFSLTILFVCASNSYAQSTVNGVVIDATGLPLPGVSVTVKGSATGRNNSCFSETGKGDKTYLFSDSFHNIHG